MLTPRILKLEGHCEFQASLGSIVSSQCGLLSESRSQIVNGRGALRHFEEGI